MKTDAIVQFLSSTLFFTEVPEKNVRLVAELLKHEMIPAHTTFINQEEDSNNVYFIYKGSVKIYRLTEEGDEITIRIVGPGEIVGELAFLDHGIRSATVETLQETEVFTLTGDDFKKILLKNPQVAINLLKIFGNLLKENALNIEEALSKNLLQRTFDMLVILANYFPEKNIALTQEELALIIGGTRARVTEVLHRLQDEGKISISHKHIQLL